MTGENHLLKNQLNRKVFIEQASKMVEVPKKNIEELTIEEASRWVSTLFNKKVLSHCARIYKKKF